MTPAQAIDWIRQLASALDAAHAAGVLHRDVKPANVMLGGGGRLLLADFGIAKSNQSADLTATGIALGTPAYMAPELARGEAATSASDRYALGVVAYELLCGRPPFVGDNALALLHQHLTTPVPAVVAARPDLPTISIPRSPASWPRTRRATADLRGARRRDRAGVRRAHRRGGADHPRPSRPASGRTGRRNARGAGRAGALDAGHARRDRAGADDCERRRRLAERGRARRAATGSHRRAVRSAPSS